MSIKNYKKVPTLRSNNLVKTESGNARYGIPVSLAADSYEQLTKLKNALRLKSIAATVTFITERFVEDLRRTL